MAQLLFTKTNAKRDGSEVILNYTPLIYVNLAYSLSFISAALQPLLKPYVTLGAESGYGAGGSAHYFITSLQVPQPSDNIGYIRRLLFNLRFTDDAQLDAFPIPSSLGISSPSFIVSNLSSGFTYYGGFKNVDLYSYDYDVYGAKPSFTYPLGVIKSGCVPFYAGPNDNIEVCCIKPQTSNSFGQVRLQLANFDMPVWNDTVTNGWVDAN